MLLPYRSKFWRMMLGGLLWAVIFFPTATWAANLYVTIRDACTSAGIPGAKLCLSIGLERPTCVTVDSAGKYTFTRVGSGTYNLAASAKGYLDQQKKVTVGLTDVSVVFYLNWAKPTVSTGSATLSHSSSSNFSVTFSGTVDPKGQATYYYFEYGQTTAYGSTTGVYYAGSGTGSMTVSATASGNILASPDHFRLVAYYNTCAKAYGQDAWIPDAFEPDDTWGQASDYNNIPAIKIIHNFHTATDVDWIKVDLTGTTNEHYLQVNDVGANSDIVMQVYDDQLNLIGEVDAAGPAGSESFKVSPPIDGPLYVRLSTTVFGQVTEYSFIDMALVCDVGFLTGTVTDAYTGNPLEGVAVYAEHTTYGTPYNITSLPGGTFYAVCCTGGYTLAASKTGYQTFNGPTSIPSPLYTRVYDVSLVAVNQPPSAAAGSDQFVEEGDLVTLDGSGSIDADDGIKTYFWQQLDGPQVALSSAAAAKPSFDAPAVGLTGATLSFKLTVTDYFGYADDDTVSVAVANRNQPPTTASAAIVTTEDTASPGVPPTVLDPDEGDVFSFMVVSQPLHGTAVQAKGKLFYTPAPDFHGQDDFTFRATDLGGLFVDGTASVTVTPVPDPPTVSDIGDQTVAKGVAFVPINLDTHVSDPEDADATLTWSTSGQSDLIVEIIDRVAFVSAPHPDWSGAETVTFTAMDPGNLSGSDAATFMVTVIEAGDLDQNFNVELYDVVLALQVVVGYQPEGVPKESDLNADGKIGLAEAIYVLQKLAGLRDAP